MCELCGQTAPRVICKGTSDSAHAPTPVYPQPRPADPFVGALYDCPVCHYDVGVDCELDEIAPGATMLDLHHLAQLATARREGQ